MITVVVTIINELNRRHTRAVTGQKSVCKYCEKETSVCIYEDPHYDHCIRFFDTANKYYFECECGSRSPVMTWGELKSRLNKPEQ